MALGWTPGLLAACSFGCFIGLALKGGFEEQNLFPFEINSLRPCDLQKLRFVPTASELKEAEAYLRGPLDAFGLF